MPNSKLTERQKHILLLLSIEFSEEQIAEELLVSESTVHQDRLKIYDLLFVHTCTAALATALLLDEITLEDLRNIRYQYGKEIFPLSR